MRAHLSSIPIDYLDTAPSNDIHATRPHTEASQERAQAARKEIQPTMSKVCGVNRRCLCYGIGAVLVPVVVIASLVGVYYPNGECESGAEGGRK